MSSPSPVAAGTDVTQALEDLREARDRTLGLVASVSDEDLTRVHSPLMSPLVWDLGHIAAFEDLWISHRYGRQRLLRAELVDVYDALETPRAHRGQLAFLGPEAAREYLDEVRARTQAVLTNQGTGDGTLVELVLRHEHQHNETMLQTLELASLEGYVPPRGDLPGPLRPSGPALTGLELVEIPGGPCTVGARAEGFAYDNERPQHRTDVGGYLIGRAPITNATFLNFVEGGGYERREWWSDEGWSWKEEYDITRPEGWTEDGGAQRRLTGLEPLHPEHPVVHVSWFEADAFARAHGARLPSEVEWEKAATWDQEREDARVNPWGFGPPGPEHANLDQLSFGTAPAGAYPGGASPYGCLGMMGDVWEWTSSCFDGYPGFSAYPYREYSEPFFANGYRVLRGGSWATRARVATATFRNWDHPQRRQIFSGLRIARDL